MYRFSDLPSGHDAFQVSQHQRLLHSQVLAIEAAFPLLHELHLAGNSISELQPVVPDLPSPHFRSLQVGPPQRNFHQCCS